MMVPALFMIEPVNRCLAASIRPPRPAAQVDAAPDGLGLNLGTIIRVYFIQLLREVNGGP